MYGTHSCSLGPILTRPCLSIAADETLNIEFTNTREAWDAWITGINASLNSLNLEVVRGLDEVTGTDMYCLVRVFLPINPPLLIHILVD